MAPLRVLFFSAIPPLPDRAGPQKRVLSTLRALCELGHDVSLALVRFPGDGMPDDGIARLRDVGVRGVSTRTIGRLDYRLGRLRRGWSEMWGGRSLGYDFMFSPGTRRWFRRTLDSTSPDLVWMTNLAGDPLLTQRGIGKVRRAVDTHDLWTSFVKYEAAAGRHFPERPQIGSVHADALSESYFDRCDVSPAAEEWACYDRYHWTFTIAEREAKSINAHCPRTSATWLPMAMPPGDALNRYDGPPLAIVTANPLNLQGAAYYSRRVAPLVLAKVPESRLRIVGSGCPHIAPAAGIELAGVVPNIRPEYERAAFFVLPTFGWTGVQVKGIEAMANGLAVVALRAVAAALPVRHEVNGLVAADAVEFAAHITRLSRDEQLCLRLGQAARETIITEYSPNRLAELLGDALNVTRKVSEPSLVRTPPDQGALA